MPVPGIPPDTATESVAVSGNTSNPMGQLNGDEFRQRIDEMGGPSGRNRQRNRWRRWWFWRRVRRAPVEEGLAEVVVEVVFEGEDSTATSPTAASITRLAIRLSARLPIP